MDDDIELQAELKSLAWIACRLGSPDYAPNNPDLYMDALSAWYPANVVEFVDRLAEKFTGER